MLIRLQRAILALQLFLCLAFAADWEQVQAPGYSTSLGIHKDPIVPVDEAQPKPIVYTTVVEYKFPVTEFSDEEIAGLGKQAWDEMVKIHTDWVNQCSQTEADKRSSGAYLNKRRPGMMSGIALGYRIYFSSSITESGKETIWQSKIGLNIKRELQACRASYFMFTGPVAKRDSDTGSQPYDHRNQGSCGEIMATALVLLDTGKMPKEHVSGSGSVRIIAYGDLGNRKNPVARVVNPCSAADNAAKDSPIGCMQYVDFQEIGKILEGSDVRRVDNPASEYLDISLKDAFRIETVDNNASS